MDVSASRFDIHSTTDSRDGCWVAFHPCTHDRASPLHIGTFNPTWPFKKTGVKFRVFISVAAALTPKARQHYHSSLVFHVVGSPFRGSFLLCLHPGHRLETIAAAGGLSGLVPSRTLLPTNLKTDNRLGLLIRIKVIALLCLPIISKTLTFGQW